MYFTTMVNISGGTVALVVRCDANKMTDMVRFNTNRLDEHLQKKLVVVRFHNDCLDEHLQSN